MHTDELWNSATAARYLGLKPATLAAWRYRRQGPRYKRIGGLIKYDPEDVKAWSDGQTIDPAARD